jgi:hypothetical protein
VGRQAIERERHGCFIVNNIYRMFPSYLWQMRTGSAVTLHENCNEGARANLLTDMRFFFVRRGLAARQ